MTKKLHYNFIVGNDKKNVEGSSITGFSCNKKQQFLLFQYASQTKGIRNSRSCSELDACMPKFVTLKLL